MNKKVINLNKINTKLSFLLFFTLIAYFGIQIVATSLGATYQDISNIRNQKEAIRKENEILLSEIEKAKSSMSAQDVIEKYNLVQKNVNFLDILDNSQAKQ